VPQTWAGGAFSLDGGRTFSSPVLLMPTTWPAARITHNLAIARLPINANTRRRVRWVALGGQFRPRVDRGAGDASPVGDTGVFLTRSATDSWCFTPACDSPSAPPDMQATQW